MKPNGIETRVSAKSYFFGPYVDFFLAGGFSILMYFFISRNFSADGPPKMLMTLAAGLLWVGNWPHFAATNLRLYGSLSTIRQYPLTATLVPVFILIGMVLSLMNPETVAPYFIKIFLLWSPYHFSGQTVGVTLIYARRANFTLSYIERRALSWFVFGTFLYATARSETFVGVHKYYDIAYPTFGLPLWVPELIAPVMWFSAIIFFWAYLRESFGRKQILPFIILVPCVAQFVWFVAGSGVQGFYEFVPFFHSIQYLLVAASMRVVEQSEIRKDSSKVLLSMGGWTLSIVCLGAILFYVLPRYIEYQFSIPLYLALGVSGAAVQIHHFFVDGVIWKLRRETVAQPLMVNAKEIFRSLSENSHSGDK
ncbi:MAG TPA: hypothetical protein PKA63_09360 [Oligoflexia bacterium]|nr:hypothetical protein [Oligoflexia bacterium]HMP48861.1 hypothetical protein [Oligoflexia bacterium]